MNENFLQAILQSIAWLLTRLLSVLTPLFIGLAIAYLLHLAVDWLTQKLRRRGLAILLTYLLAACFLGGLICGFVILILGALPQGSPREITTQIFAYFESAYQAADAYLSDFLPDGMPSPIAAGLGKPGAAFFRRGRGHIFERPRQRDASFFYRFGRFCLPSQRSGLLLHALGTPSFCAAYAARARAFE